jgi:hypothetical protein
MDARPKKLLGRCEFLICENLRNLWIESLAFTRWPASLELRRKTERDQAEEPGSLNRESSNPSCAR